jgi:transposase
VELQAKLAALEARLAQLEAQLAAAKKTSANSSKPPSSDIVKPKRKAADPQGKKRKQGAQPGHPKHERPPFTEDQIDYAWEYYLDTCPDCGGPVVPTAEPPRTLQQVELPAAPVAVTEHRGLACFCRQCQRTHHAPIEEAVRRAGLVGPQLSARIAYLKGACHCSFSTIRKYVRDLCQLSLSRGQLAKVIAKASDSLEKLYNELLALLPDEERLNVDETGHKDRGQRMWTWCFRAPLFTLFKISPSRGSEVLLETLGAEFDGVLGCDYFSAYRKYMGQCSAQVQFCLAHLIRDLKFLAEHPDGPTKAYGKLLLQRARELFAVIHCKDELDPARFAIELANAADQLSADAVYRVPASRAAQNLARRFEKHGESYLRFVTTPGVEPTNNLAEQAIRFVVIDRLVTQGSRGETGQRWLERIWTLAATCAQHGRSMYEYLCESIAAHFGGQESPSLNSS